MWRLSKLALKSRIVTIILATMVTGASVWALMGLKMELLPDIEFPYATIVTVYPEAAPEEVVEKVTGPIEEIIWDNWSTSELNNITSTSSRGISLIMAEFEFGTDMEKINTTLQSEISKLSLPDEVINFPEMSGAGGTNPQIIPINLDMLPTKILSVSGNLTPDELRSITEEKIVPALIEVEGVLRVEVEGGAREHIVVNPDPDLMNQFGVSMAQIAASIPGLSTSFEEVASAPLNEGVVLEDIAEINKGPTPASMVTRFNGNPSIGISIFKEEEANIVEVADNIAAMLDETGQNIPEGVLLSTVLDQSDFIKDSIDELWQKAITGGLLAIAIVFIFLRAVRSSLLAAMSVPLSVLVAFLCMYVSGITINILTLSGISIAIGRLIDDSIVMVEVIYRRRQMGESFKDAALGGAKEVATPITAATLATVSIFIPLMFIGGMVGELFIPFGLTIAFALLGSLAVALMVVPVLSRYLIKIKTSKDTQADKSNWYQNTYQKGLGWSLKHRALVLVVAIVLFVSSIGLIPIIGTSFMPDMGEPVINIEIELPPGSETLVTSQAASKVEAVLADRPLVESYYTTIGTSASLAGMTAAAQGGGSNTASITVYLERGADIEMEAEELSGLTEGIIENGSIFVSSGGDEDMMGSSNVNLSIQGQDPDEVRQVTSQLIEQLKEIDGLTDVAADITEVVTRLDIAVDEEKLITSGLPLEQLEHLQQELALLMAGSTLPEKMVSIDERSYPVFLSSVTPKITSVEQAQALSVGYPESVTLGQIADIAYKEAPSHISRTGLSLSATVTGNITARDVGAVNAAIEREINKLPPHPGVEIKTAGIAELMEDSFSRMSIALLSAVGLVLVVMFIMMRSVINPLIILVSLPMASIGAMLGLLFTGHTLNMFAMLGTLMLVGIVLTNAVVLISLVENLRKGGYTTHEALLEGGRRRIRPILMTALTTIFAMLPLAIGLGSGMMMTAELAVVVIGGLFSSTVLTLFVIPVIYSLVHRGATQRASE